jgi:UDP-glucose 4-epimerase
MNRKKIIVTGGCGYIGSHTIIELFNNTDYEVLSIDNTMNSSEDALLRVKEITSKEVKNIKIDLRDYKATSEVFRETENIAGVIHFAALKSVPDSVANPYLYYDNNINSLINILKCCEEFNVKNFIFSSSCSVYGDVRPEALPVKEETELNMAESPYGHTKQVGEKIIKFFTDKGNLNAILLRYFNPVGAHISGLNGELSMDKPNNLVPLITQVAAGLLSSLQVYGFDYDTRDGSCIRDYVHVSDIASAHIKALNYLIDGKNSSEYEIFNLGSGQGVTVLEAIHAFEKVSGVKLNYKMAARRKGDVAQIYSDSLKAMNLLNWKTEYSIEEMMMSAWKWQINLKNKGF